MNKMFFLLIFLVSGCLCAQFQINRYQNKNYFQNPIFAGDNPDPSILVDGDDYYITFSSFDYYPGLPIWHSKDLINWEPVAHGVTKNVGSVWAPDLIKHKEKYYIYFPANKTNWVVWANSIEGPWSEPIDLKVKHIDPGHIVAEDGKRYIHLSQGHYVQLADDGLSIVGEVKKSYEGWRFPKEWSVETFGLEGPKLMKHKKYYYMTVAQGGTAGPATSHMVVSARSKTPFGPWENSPYNPIVRTENKTEKWWSKGHGTPFKDVEGNWWLVFHGYENGFYEMGRQTLLQPIEWTKEGWFKIPSKVKTDKAIARPKIKSSTVEFNLSDNFSGDKLKFQWQFYKDNDPKRFRLADNKFILKGTGSTAGDAFPMLSIPLHHSYSAEVDVEAKNGTIGGLTLFYSEKGFVSFGVDESKIYFSNNGWQRPIEEIQKKDKISLKLVNNEGTVDFYYCLDGVNWIKTEHSASVSSFNHNAYGGFLSLKLGLYATGKGEVKFSDFKYKEIK